MKNVLFFVLSALMLMSVSGCGKGEELASVNGRKITSDDVALEIENLPQEYRMFAQSPEMRRRLVDNLVVAELLLQAAEAEGVMTKPEIQQKIKEAEISIKAETEAKLEALKLQKDRAAKIAKREVVIKNFRENRDFTAVAVTDKEIQEQYKSYSSMMKQRDPNAKVEAYDRIKEDIKKSIAMQKTVEELKRNANIKINEAAFPAEPPMSFNAQPGVKTGAPDRPAPAQVEVK